MGRGGRRQGREGRGRPCRGHGTEGLREGGREGEEYKEKEEKNSETFAPIVLRAKRNRQGTSSGIQICAISAATQQAPAGVRHSPRLA